MSVVNEVHAGAVAVKPLPDAAVKKAPWWERKALFRYGFVALILIVWEVTGPFVNPIFFSYPSKIAVAFYELTVSGELPYYLAQSLEVMFCGLFFAIVVGIPLAVLMARVRWGHPTSEDPFHDDAEQRS